MKKASITYRRRATMMSEIDRRLAHWRLILANTWAIDRGSSGAAMSGARRARASAGWTTVLTISLALLPGPAMAANAVLVGGTVLSTAVLVAAVLLAAWAYRQASRGRAFLRETLDAAPQGLQVVDNRGRSVLANAAFGRMFEGDSRALLEQLGERAVDEMAKADLERLGLRVASEGAGQTAVRLNMTGPDGSTDPHWFKVRGEPLTIFPGHYLWSIESLDAGAAIAASLEREQDKILALLDLADMGFFKLDQDGHIAAANQTLATWLELPKEQLQRAELNLEDVASQSDSDTESAELEDSETDCHEARFKTASGRHFRARIMSQRERDEAGQDTGRIALLRNMSTEHSLSATLARMEKRIESFFEQAPVGIALVDDHGRLVESNAAVSELTGLEQDALGGMRLIDLMSEPSRAPVEAALKRASVTEDEEAKAAPIEVRLASRPDTVCALFVTCIDEGVGAKSRYITHFIDTTEQKVLELQFAQSQKMQAVGQLAGGIAHDFNNLLTAMIGFSDLLLLRHPPGDQSFADIMQIKQNANRAANLVRQLLAFSRQQTLQPRVLNVTDILAELSHLLQRLIGENIELKMYHGRDLGTVKADQGQLDQVIINLAVNARDAMQEGGTLTIRTENLEIARPRTRRGDTLPPGSYTMIEVSDTGCGVDAENLDRIFDPFFTTKEVGAGTGLGLATVYGIVKQTGGFIFVDSTPGKGTSFFIYLPHFAEAPSAAETAAAAEGGKDLTGVGTLLLVEDEEAVRAFSARALRNKGYNVLEAPSGEVALQLLNEQGDPIDLLITDVVMPKIDGPTLVREVRDSRPDLKVIFISGYAEDSFRKRLDEDSRIHFLPKPFTLKQLAGKVKEVMAEDAA